MNLPGNLLFQKFFFFITGARNFRTAITHQKIHPPQACISKKHPHLQISQSNGSWEKSRTAHNDTSKNNAIKRASGKNQFIILVPMAVPLALQHLKNQHNAHRGGIKNHLLRRLQSTSSESSSVPPSPDIPTHTHIHAHTHTSRVRIKPGFSPAVSQAPVDKSTWGIYTWCESWRAPSCCSTRRWSSGKRGTRAALYGEKPWKVVSFLRLLLLFFHHWNASLRPLLRLTGFRATCRARALAGPRGEPRGRSSSTENVGVYNRSHGIGTTRAIFVNGAARLFFQSCEHVRRVDTLL